MARYVGEDITFPGAHVGHNDVDSGVGLKHHDILACGGSRRKIALGSAPALGGSRLQLVIFEKGFPLPLTT